ncbi:MAG: Na+/H+ antiporter NhaA [Deltaproteobacteria bacterium]|nr:Na+/H+ antiporter NhaA [Deltaproteobacteria bacterium]
MADLQLRPSRHASSPHRFERHAERYSTLTKRPPRLASRKLPFGFPRPPWLVLGGLIVGKTVGIYLLGLLGHLLGLPLPEGMGKRELFLAGLLAGNGFTVALFIAGEAFTDPRLQAEAKMGAMLSILAMALAAALGRALGAGKRR